MTRLTSYFNWLRALAVITPAVLCTSPAKADVDLRVESRPRTDPIETFARVTNNNGPVIGLTAADFAVTLDGAPLQEFTVGLPPAEDSAQRLSIVLVVNNGGFASAAEDAVRDFITRMAVGDYAAVISTRYSIDSDLNIPIVHPFTQIDGGTGTNSLVDAVRIVSREGFPQMLRSLVLALDQFVTPPVELPAGPKAIIVLGKGRVEITSYGLEEVVSYASQLGIPIFSIEIGDNSFAPYATALMRALATDTGGVHLASDDSAAVAEAYRRIAELLTTSYRLSIPRDAVTDCNLHTLEIVARGQANDATFNRCDTTPDRFFFNWNDAAAPGTVIVSEAVIINGIDGPTGIAVANGEYSIGCAATFTSAPGYVLPGERVCVRHTAAAERGVQVGTTLMVGGMSGLFVSTVAAAPSPPPPPPPRAGGGGATGPLELLLALGWLMARRALH